MLGMQKIWGLVTTILGGALALLVIAQLLPTWFPALADINGVLTNESTTTGDPVADGIMPVFTIVIGILGLLAVVGWVTSSFGSGGTGRRRGYGRR